MLHFFNFSSKYIIVFIFVIVHLILCFYLVSLHQSCTFTDDLVKEITKLSGELQQYTNNVQRSRNNEQTREEFQPIKNNTKPYFYQDALDQSRLLNRSYGHNTVYYIWCGKRWFEFVNYMSMKSVIKAIRPDSLVFLYDVYPVVDEWNYNTWLGELLHEFPFLRVSEVANKQFACSGHARANFDYISSLLTERGGFFVSEYTIVVDFPVEFRAYDVVDAWDYTKQAGFLYAKKGLPGSKSFKELLAANAADDGANLKTKRYTCLTDITYPKTNRKTPCVIQMRPYFPKDIWDLDNSFGKLVRTIFYGDSRILSPQPSEENLIPNIAHVVWIGGNPMDFLFLLSILSLIHVAKVEAVYLHVDAPPTGSYWDLVKNHPHLHIILRDHPGTVYNTPVNVLSHVTDIWRVDFMLKYGGIYVDTDTVFVRPLDRRIRSYEAVSTYDWTYWNHPFPDTINFGVSIGKRGAKFWHKFQESMRWFIDTDWAWNGLRQPYKVKERNPDLILVDPHLSVICYKSLCHPTWHPDYHNESVHHLNSNSIADWRNDVFAFHWTLPTPYELLNHTTLFASKSMFADIATYVLREAKLYEHFNNLVATERGKLETVFGKI